MKRSAEAPLTNSLTKKTKTTCSVIVPTQIQPQTIPNYNDQLLFIAKAHQRLSFLIEEYNNLMVQSCYLQAIEENNIAGVFNCFTYHPKRSFLEFAIGLGRTAITDIILKYGKPTQQELNASLYMAIGSQNIQLSRALLDKGAYFNDQNKPIHPRVKKVLSEKVAMVNLIARYMDLKYAVKYECEEIVKTILQKTKIQQSLLNTFLNYAAYKQNIHLMRILIEAGADSSMYKIN